MSRQSFVDGGIEYFVVLADELHFGRAAEKLHMTSPALSQRISKLERTLGFPLFVRTSRSVTLTDAARDMLPHARSLVAVGETLSRWRDGHLSGMATIKIGFVAAGAGTLLNPILTALRAEFPGTAVEIRHLEWSDQLELLYDGTLDAVFVREPFPHTDERCALRRTTVLSERRVVVLPRHHRLAGRPSLKSADLYDEVFLVSAAGPDEWTSFWMLEPRPDGKRARRGTSVSTLEELLEQCATGAGITTTPESVQLYYRHPDIVFVPVADADPTEVTLCCRAGERSDVLRRLESLALEISCHRSTEDLDTATG